MKLSFIAVFLAAGLVTPPLLDAQTTDTQPRTVRSWPAVTGRVSQIVPVADANAGCIFQTGANCTADDQSYINNWIEAAAATWVSGEVELDVSVAISACVVDPIGFNLTVRGLGAQTTGLFVLANSATTAIGTANGVSGALSHNCNTGYWGLNSTPSRAGSLVVSELGINGNRANNGGGTNYACLTSSPTYGWCADVSAANLLYYEASNVYLYNSPTFGSDVTNTARVVGRNVNVTATNLANPNTDGFHIDGLVDSYDVDGVYCATGDDCVPVNPAEGYGGSDGPGTIANVVMAGSLTVFRTYCNQTGIYLGPVTIIGVTGFAANHSGVDSAAAVRLGYGNDGSPDCLQSVTLIGADLETQDWTFGTHPARFIDVEDNVGSLHVIGCKWRGPWNAQPVVNFTGASTVSDMVLTSNTIYQTAAEAAAAWWVKTFSGAAITRLEFNGDAITAEQGISATTVPYAMDIVSGSTVGNLVLTALDPANTTTLLNGNEWSRITNFYGAGVSNYFRNVTYAHLPPATFTGLSASVSDSNTQTWGATVAGSSSSYAQITSDGSNWTVTGK